MSGRTRVFRSLRIRMAISHGVVLAAIFLILGATGYAILARVVDRQVTAGVVDAAREQVSRIQEHGLVPVPVDPDDPASSTDRVAVFLPDGSPAAHPSDAPSWLRPQPARVATATARGEQVRIVTLPVARGGTTIAIVVAGRALAPVDELLGRVRLLLVLGGLIAVAASMGAGWFLAGRAVRPVSRAYEAQANFAADASHELRTPLAFIRAGVEVLAEHEPDLGADVLQEVDYLAGLTDRLLTLARADEASLALRPVPLPLMPICKRAVERNEQVHGVRVSVLPESSAESGSSVPTDATGGAVALADPVTIEAVVDAVLENVARHGGGAADLSVRRVDGRVLLRLADHGPGLAPEQRAAAFERFFRADPSRARELGGAGLGLALARELVVAQHGRMWLEETPGGGLTAVVDLPAA